jgi:hypothetical protein
MKQICFIIFVMLAASASADDEKYRWLTFQEIDVLVDKLDALKFPAAEEEILAVIPRKFSTELSFASGSGPYRKWLTIFLTDPYSEVGFFSINFERDVGSADRRYEGAVLKYSRRSLKQPNERRMFPEVYDLKKVFGKERPNQSLEHNDHGCHGLCGRTLRASHGRG